MEREVKAVERYERAESVIAGLAQGAADALSVMERMRAIDQSDGLETSDHDKVISVLRSLIMPCSARDPLSPRRCVLPAGHDGDHRDADDVCDWCFGQRVEPNEAPGVIKDRACHRCRPVLAAALTRNEGT